MHAERETERRILGNYELVRLLATGGMAEVYEARRAGVHGFSKRFALKRILPQLARDERLVQMFCDEARIHAGLSHPNLVEVVDFGEADEELYMVMEYVEGLSAAELMSAVAARRRRFELGPALHCAREVANALAYAHDASDENGRPLGLIHRDVAPSNILIAHAGAIKLADFGIMRSSLLTQRTAPGEVKGKIGYVSPEQAVGASLDARSDLFSLAVVITEMLIGRPLFPGNNEFEILRCLHACDLGVLRAAGRHIPPDVTAILVRALSKRPGQRHPSARAFAADIQGAIRRHEVELGARGMAEWLTELGIAPIESGVRQKQLPSVAIAAADAEADTLRGGAAAYRLRRGETVSGPHTLPHVLEQIATGELAPETPVALHAGPFVPLMSRIELARLAARPPFRFVDFVGLRASARWPIEAGTLPGHLFELARERRTGLLVARSEAVQVRVYFVQGDPVFATSTRAGELLGRRLIEGGLVGAEALERCLTQGYSAGQRVGEALVTAGLLDAATVSAALASQRLARLTTLCRMRTGELFFVDGELSGEPVSGLGTPFKLLARAVRDAYDDATLQALLAGAAPLALFASAQASELSIALELPPQEAYVLLSCGRGETLRALAESLVVPGRCDEAGVRRAVFLGLSAGVITARPAQR